MRCHVVNLEFSVLRLPCSHDYGEHGGWLLCPWDRAFGECAKDLEGYPGRVFNVPPQRQIGHCQISTGRWARTLPANRRQGVPKKHVYQISIITHVHLLLPCQKMAQRDQAGMVELLQNCCLMNHVWPLLQGYLGQGTELNSIMAQWKLGNLGCTGFAKTSQRLYFWQDRF